MATELRFAAENKNPSGAGRMRGSILEEKYEVTDCLLLDHSISRERYEVYLEPIDDLQAHTERVRACIAFLQAEISGLLAKNPAPGGFWIFWAWFGARDGIFENQHLETFEEHRVFEFGGRAPMARLVLGRDLLGHPLFELFNVDEHADLTGARMVCETPFDGPVTVSPKLDRLDGYPELKALWLGRGRDRCAILVVTQDPLTALRRLRSWKFPSRQGSLERTLYEQQQWYEQAPERTWATYRLRQDLRASGHPRPDPTLRQLALRRLVSPAVLRPDLDLQRPSERIQTQTRAVGLRVHRPIALRVADLFVLRTFVDDDVREESSYRYLPEDYEEEELHRTWTARIGARSFPVLELTDPDHFPASTESPRAGARSFPVLKLTDLNHFPAVRAPLRHRDDPDDDLERLAAWLDKTCLTNDGPLQEGIRVDPRLSSQGGCFDISLNTVIAYREWVQPRRLAFPRRAGWLVRNFTRERLPELERECLFLNFVFPVRWQGAPAPAVLRGVLQVRLPLAVAWHGVEFTGLFVGGARRIFVASDETGVFACLGDHRSAGHAQRLELNQAIAFEGLLKLDPSTLFWADPAAPEDPGARAPVECLPGTISHLIVTGVPDLTALSRRLPPISGTLTC